MAHLDSKTTSGLHAWDKYIKHNQNWQKLELVTEDVTDVYEKVQTKLQKTITIPQKTSLKLKSQAYETIEGKKYASVIINHRSYFVPINKIRKPTSGNGTQYEVEVVDNINRKIKENGNIPIDIRIPNSDNKVYRGITGAVQVNSQIKQAGGAKADPKADIILYSDANKYLLPSNIFISHKKEGGPEAFQQYSGITEKAGDAINNHPEVQRFLEEVIKYIDNDKLARPLMKRVRDPRLINLSVFGPNYGREFGINNVQIIGQGMGRLVATNEENLYHLEFSSHMVFNGRIGMFTGDYTAVLGATYRAGRGFEYRNTQYNGARIGIYPIKLMRGRSDILEL